MSIKISNPLSYHPQAGDLVVAKPKQTAQENQKEVKKDVNTNEINKSCVLFFREGIKNNTDLANKLEKIAEDYLFVKGDNQSMEKADLSALFKEAIYRFSQVTNEDVSYTLRENQASAGQDEFADYVNQAQANGLGTLLAKRTIRLKYTGGLEATKGSGKSKRPIPAADKRISPKKLKSMDKDIQRLAEAYDRLKASEANMEKLSRTLIDRLLSKDTIYLDTVVLGGGDAATEYWLDMHKGSHGKINDLLNKHELAFPSTLMLAKDTGNWKHDYTLAQTFSLLERGDAPANPQMYALSDKYAENRHVNARFLYQSNVVNLSETEAPIILGTEVLGVEKKDRHAADWKADASGAPCRVKTRFKTASELKEAPIVVSDAAVEKLYDSLKVNGKTKEDFANALISRLTSDNSPRDYKAKAQRLSSAQIVDLAGKKDGFDQIKKDLGIGKDVTQVDFSRRLQNFMRTVASETLAEEKRKIRSATDAVDTPYEYLALKTSPEGIPKIEGGKLVMGLEKCINKYLYTKELNVCTGFGVTREISSAPFENKSVAGAILRWTPEQIKMEDKDILCHFDTNKKFTPVIDGNTYMLTGREETGVKRDIIIYGGGGNATACYRKSFFGEDNNAETRTYEAQTQMPNNITWFAREGFELAGYGRLAKQALTYAKENDQLCTGDLIRVEAKPDGSGRVLVYMKDTTGTYEGVKVEYSDQKNRDNPASSVAFQSDLSTGNKGTKIIDQVRVFECDQFIYTIGQEGKPIKSIFDDYDLDKEAQVYTDPVSKMPLGVKTKDDALKFWGATALTLSPSEKGSVVMRAGELAKVKQEYKDALEEAQKREREAVTTEEKSAAKLALLKAKLLKHKVAEHKKRVEVSRDKESRKMTEWASAFNDNLRDWIVVQRIARDAEWPGVMPPSRVSNRQAEFLLRSGMNINAEEQFLEFAKEEELVARIEVDELNGKLAQRIPDDTKAELLEQLTHAQERYAKAIENVVKAQARVIEAEKQFDSVNANLDDIEYINGFMIKAGVEDPATRFEFMAALLDARESAYQNEKFPGMDKHAIAGLIKHYGLQPHLEVRGNSSIGIKKRAR